jgi:hypothetical protein
MRRFFRNNGLSICLALLFLAFWAGQAVTGFEVFNDDLREHGALPLSFSAYLASAHFFEATAENWESEFLQMAAYVVLTAILFQRGSAESKDPDDPVVEGDRVAAGETVPADAPWPVRRGGWILALYGHSLGLALFLFFLLSFAAHAVSGWKLETLERAEHGEAAQSFGDFLASATFWFQSLQNWQSEFLAVLSIVLLSIVLRQKGSPESKPVTAPHRQTG